MSREPEQTEITFEMVAAGASVIGALFHEIADPHSLLASQAATEVFEAMQRARAHSTRSPCE